jgi:hypothetical protein
MMRSEANGEVLRRFAAAEPILIDVRSALDVVPGMTATTVLTSGAVAVAPRIVATAQRYLHAAVSRGPGARRAGGGSSACPQRDPDRALPPPRLRGSVPVPHRHDAGIRGQECGGGKPQLLQFYEGDSRRRLNYGSFGLTLSTDWRACAMCWRR